MKRIFSFLILSIFLVSAANAQVFNEQLHKFGRVLNLVNSLYVDSVDDEKLVEDAIIAMLKELDPHSIYISNEEVQEMNEPLEGAFEGIGIQFNILNDTLMVVSTIPGGPSEKQGLMAGDRIVKVDGENIAGIGLKNSDVRDMLRGEKGTKVNIKVKRRSADKLLSFDIVRDKIPIFSVHAGYRVEADIGYIKLNRFAKTTRDELDEIFIEFDAQDVSHLIVDLSGNGGGYMDQAISLADHFLEKDRLVVYTEGKHSMRREYDATAQGKYEDGRVVVIVDEGSASASEIFSGAIQDWDRGVIVGRRTFGKGLVQRPFLMPDSSMIRLTIARYYTPTGRLIQKSYENGSKEYSRDLISRYNHGELINEDSIHFPDSLKYQTLNNRRMVFGGGGIMPDVFVPLDTSAVSDYHGALIRQAVIFPFALEYVDKNRQVLQKKYPDFETFQKNFKVDEQMMGKLDAYARDKEIQRDSFPEMTPHQHDRLVYHVKSLIASDMWDTNEFYRVFNNVDKTYQEALDIVRDKKRYHDILNRKSDK